MVEVTHYGSAHGFDMVHLVNGSGHYGVSFFAPVSMQDLEVVIEYPNEPHRVHSLVTGREVEASWANGRLTIHVPTLHGFDAIRIE